MSSVVRVKMTLLIDGQATEIDRTISGATQWDEVTEADVMAFARELLDLGMVSLGYRDRQTENGLVPLTVRLSPGMPDDDSLRAMFIASGGQVERLRGLRAIWRNGCDAGMVAS